MIFGAVVDPDMGEDIRITVIATGFERSAMPRRISAQQLTPIQIATKCFPWQRRSM